MAPFLSTPALISWFPLSQKAYAGFGQLVASEPWESWWRAHIRLIIGQTCSPNISEVMEKPHPLILAGSTPKYLEEANTHPPRGRFLLLQPRRVSANNHSRAAGSPQSALTCPQGNTAFQVGTSRGERQWEQALTVLRNYNCQIKS